MFLTQSPAVFFNLVEIQLQSEKLVKTIQLYMWNFQEVWAFLQILWILSSELYRVGRDKYQSWKSVFNITFICIISWTHVSVN